MTDTEYALLANAVTELDAAILRQMQRRAEAKEKIVELLDVADLLLGRARVDSILEASRCKSVLKELRKTIETL